MPIMRAPSSSNKTFKIPCSGEGIFVSVNTLLGFGAASVADWNGNSMQLVINSNNCRITSITVQDGVATVMVTNESGSYNESARVCFIPGNPLTSN